MNRLENETPEQIDALAIYGAMPPGRRSLRKLAEQLGKPVGTVNAWALRNCWTARLEAASGPSITPMVNEAAPVLGAKDLEGILIRLLSGYEADQRQFPGAQPPKGMAQLFNAWRAAKAEERRAKEALPPETEESRQDLTKLTDLQLQVAEVVNCIALGAVPPMKDAEFFELIGSDKVTIQRAIFGDLSVAS